MTQSSSRSSSLRGATTTTKQASVVSDSTRSWKSWTSDGAPGSTSAHSNLMRTHAKRDPMTVYEVVKLLGEGSMGSVAKVKKRDDARGGSARKAFVDSHSHHGPAACCFPLLSFIKMRQHSSKFESIISSDKSHETYNLGDSLRSTSSASRSESKKSQQTPGAARDYHRSSSSQIISYGHKKDSFYALKSILLDRCQSKEYKRELLNEVEILKQLDHPNIVKAMETYDYNGRLFLVLELCSGGDLYTRDPYTEDEAARIVTSLLSAVAYLHENNIVHRDLKFENIMFSSLAANAEIKLIDFGLSQKYAQDEHLKDAVGTVYTMAPELLKGDYDAKADVWSIGVITFMLLSSSMPFFGRDRTHVIKKIISGKFKFSGRRWKKVDVDAKVFVRDLLEYDPTKRPTAERALELSWLNRDVTEATDSLVEAMDKIQANIEVFAEYSMLKKLALMVIAYQSTSEELGTLKKMFTKFDRSHNGVITLDEFKEAILEFYTYSDEDLEKLFKGIDIDGSGKVHYSEFLAATLESVGSIDEERLAEAFDRIDIDDTGYITASDLRNLLGENVPLDYLDAIIDEADLLHDHRISYDEFLAMWNIESDEKLQKAKNSVCTKHLESMSRTSSFTSNGTDDSAQGTHRGLHSRNSSLSTQDGVFYFSKQKNLSVRGEWV